VPGAWLNANISIIQQIFILDFRGSENYAEFSPEHMGQYFSKIDSVYVRLSKLLKEESFKSYSYSNIKKNQLVKQDIKLLLKITICPFIVTIILLIYLYKYKSIYYRNLFVFSSIILILLICFIGWNVASMHPKGYKYIDDFIFVPNVPVQFSTKELLVYERPELRPENPNKIALFSDGSVDLLTIEQIKVSLKKP